MPTLPLYRLLVKTDQDWKLVWRGRDTKELVTFSSKIPFYYRSNPFKLEMFDSQKWVQQPDDILAQLRLFDPNAMDLYRQVFKRVAGV